MKKLLTILLATPLAVTSVATIKLASDVSTLEAEAIKSNNTIEDLNNQLSRIEADLSITNIALEKETSVLNDTKANLIEITAKLSDENELTASQKIIIDDLTSRLAKSEMNNNELSEVIAKLNDTNKELLLDNSDLQDQLTSALDDINEQLKIVSNLESTVKSLTSNLERLNSELADKITEIEKANEKITDLENENNDLWNKYYEATAIDGDVLDGKHLIKEFITEGVFGFDAKNLEFDLELASSIIKNELNITDKDSFRFSLLEDEQNADLQGDDLGWTRSFEIRNKDVIETITYAWDGKAIPSWHDETVVNSYSVVDLFNGYELVNLINDNDLLEVNEKSVSLNKEQITSVIKNRFEGQTDVVITDVVENESTNMFAITIKNINGNKWHKETAELAYDEVENLRVISEDFYNEPPLHAVVPELDVLVDSTMIVGWATAEDKYKANFFDKGIEIAEYFVNGYGVNVIMFGDGSEKISELETNTIQLPDTISGKKGTFNIYLNDEVVTFKYEMDKNDGISKIQKYNGELTKIVSFFT